MRAETILELARFVLGPGFTVAAAETLFGPVTPTHLVGRITLAPRDPLHGRVEIETRGGVQPMGLLVQLAELVEIDFAPLVAAFGEPEQRPRQKPDHPIPWRFTADGGWVTLETTSDEPRRRHRVARVRVRRAADNPPP